MKTIPLVMVAMVLGGCGKAPGKSAAADSLAGDTLTTRQRQEAVGKSGIPGARGITRALEVADSAAARAAAIDTSGR